MNAPAKKPAAAETVEDVLAKLDARREANLRIWNALGKTDPKHTKQFSRAGGFKGTAIKPIWITQRLTEQFGPCGKGWGFEKPEFQIVPALDEIMVYCTVTAWYLDGEPGQHIVYGVGGDKVITKFSSGLKTDDEAFKKAFTDALGNAFKFVGVGADVHMGQFDDSKYVAELRKEFEEPKKTDNPTTGEPKPRERVKYEGGPYTCPTQLMTAAREFVRTLESLGDLDEFIAWSETDDYKQFCSQLERDMPAWWETGEGMPAEFVPLEMRIKQKRADLERMESVR